MSHAAQTKGVFYFAGIALGIVLLALLGYFAYLLVISNDQSRLAVLTAAVSIGTLVYTQSRNTRREIEGRHFAKKAEAYEGILLTISDLMKAGRTDTPIDEAALTERLSDFLPKLLIWAGPEVLLAWQRMATPSDSPFGPLKAGNDLIAALRKELGHSSDHVLGPLGLVAIFVKAEDHLKMESALN